MRNEGYRSGKMKNGGVDRTKRGRGETKIVSFNICKYMQGAKV